MELSDLFREKLSQEKKLIKAHIAGEIPCARSYETGEAAIRLGRFFIDRGYRFAGVKVGGGITSYNDGTAAYHASYQSFEDFVSLLSSDWDREYKRVRDECGGWVSLELISHYIFTFKNAREAEEIRVCYFVSGILSMIWVEPCPHAEDAIAETARAARKEFYGDDRAIKFETKYVKENRISWEF